MVSHSGVNGIVCSSAVSLSAGREPAAKASLTDGDAKAALELVLAVVEEGGEDQRERQREQLLF